MSGSVGGERLARLRIAHLGLHPDRTRRLRHEFGSATNLVAAARRGRVRLPAGAREVLGWSEQRLLEATPPDQVVMLGDPQYPPQLGQLPDAPDVLFVQGSIPPEPMVAVVGTRTCTGYGRQVAGAIGRASAGAGWPVVSGLARGIDGAAHRGSLAAGAIPGVAVLGTGLDLVYPAEHADLARALIRDGGAVVTEYPPGTRPDGWRFPPRNRVISGLASAVVVVEAPVKGGSLITAAHALDHGRPLFAVPGDIDRDTSRGCNMLIRDGAAPVLDIEDLITGLSFVLGPPPAAERSVSVHVVTEAVGSGGCSVDDLAMRLALPVPELLTLIAHAESAGEVTVENGWIERR